MWVVVERHGGLKKIEFGGARASDILAAQKSPI